MLLLFASTLRLIFLAFKYVVVVCLFVYTYCPVYPNRESGQKLLVFLAPFFRKLRFYSFGFKVYYFLQWSTKYRIIATLLVYLTCQYNFGQEEDNIFCCLTIAIPDILKGIFVLLYRNWHNILEYISDRQAILDNLVQIIWVSFNEQQHNIYSD